VISSSLLLGQGWSSVFTLSSGTLTSCGRNVSHANTCNSRGRLLHLDLGRIPHEDVVSWLFQWPNGRTHPGLPLDADVWNLRYVVLTLLSRESYKSLSGPQFWQYPLNDYVGGFPDSWTLSSIVVAATLFLAVVIHTPFR